MVMGRAGRSRAASGGLADLGPQMRLKPGATSPFLGQDRALISSRMANKYYAPDEQRAAKVNDLFATIAPRYDLINDLQSFGLHRLWKRRLVKLAAPAPGERALDVCCGTGDVAFALARRGVDVVGLDF